MQQVKTLQLEHDLDFQRAEWRLSRVVLAGLIATMVATGLGVFGNGPLSHARAGDHRLSVEYDRILRFGGSARVVVHTAPDVEGVTTLHLDGAMLDAFRVTGVTPPPERARLSAGGAEYVFAAEASATGPITLELQPARRWRMRGTLRTPAASVTLDQFILP